MIKSALWKGWSGWARGKQPKLTLLFGGNIMSNILWAFTRFGPGPSISKLKNPLLVRALE
jgi:hypothetical protein